MAAPPSSGVRTRRLRAHAVSFAAAGLAARALTPAALHARCTQPFTVVIKVGTSSLLRQDKNCIHLSQARRQRARSRTHARASPDASPHLAPRCALHR
jgi:hypothetical protein